MQVVQVCSFFVCTPTRPFAQLSSLAERGALGRLYVWAQQLAGIDYLPCLQPKHKVGLCVCVRVRVRVRVRVCAAVIAAIVIIIAIVLLLFLHVVSRY